MQDTETLNDGLKRSYSLTVTADVIEAKMAGKLETARADFQMKGFRKGKAPAALMKKMFGKSVMGEAMQEAVDEVVKAHFTGTGDRPAAQPDVKFLTEDWQEGHDMVFEMTYERLPEVPETDFSGLELERLVASVEEAAVAEALDNLASAANHFEPRAAGEAAQSGDQVTVDFLGRIDGEAFEGGAAEDYPLVIGSGTFIPGFEEQLIGVVAGEERTVSVTFPDSYGAKNLAGRAAEFAITVKDVKAPAPAPVDDALATRFGAESLADLRAQITDRLGVEYQGAARQILKRKLMDALDGLVSFDLPSVLVEQEANQVAHQLWHEANPDHHGHDHGAIEVTDENRALASRRVRLGLLLAEVGSKAKIVVSENELNQAIMRQAMQYRGQEKQFFDFVRNNPQVLQSIQAPIFEDKVVDHILSIAKVTEKPVSKDELQAAMAALDA